MNENDKTTVYLLGDSITQGLGSKKVNFTGELADLLGEGYEIVNLAYTGTTIDYALGLLDNGIIAPGGGRSLCVVLYGNVDAQIRPNRMGKVFPLIPKRFQGGGMLMPRPFYSRAWSKRLGQIADNVARRFFSSLIKAVDGTEQWVPLDSFKAQYGELLNRLRGMNMLTIACSCIYIDERLFPGTPNEYLAFNDAIRAHASQRRIPYVDMWSIFKEEVEANGWDDAYNKDHFHPNGVGYGLMAEAIAAAVLEYDLKSSGRCGKKLVDELRR